MKYSQYRICKEFLIQKKGKIYTIFDGEKSVLYSFNEMGSLIFNCMQKNMALEQVIKKLQIMFPSKSEKILERDLLNFFWDLAEKGIVEISV